MKFALTCYGTRGDIEAGAAVGRELVRRGHEVRMGVPPDLVGFVESAGVATIPYGPDTQAHCNLWKCFPPNVRKTPDLIKWLREARELTPPYWRDMTATLTSLADGADLLLSGPGFEVAANVAEYHDIPLATLHWMPVRPNGKLLPFLPSPLSRSALAMYEWMCWRGTKKAEDEQRRELGLPKAARRAPRRITDRGSLEIQAYDKVCFPGLAAEWAKWSDQRPFVGTLTLELATEADDEIASWIAADTPPIFFGFGSIPVSSPADTLEMISAACAQLGERALICAAGTDFDRVAHSDHVKVADTMNYAAIFPACRAVVHHGGFGTTAAGLRAGVPTLILWRLPDQPIWGGVVKRLGVGTARQFASTTQQSLVADLRRVLAPQNVTRAREVATQMTKSTDSVAAAATRVEDFARLQGVG
jgi:UDP:flavonoid glycosyltransferase YjiC (YdhE family)